MRIERSIWRRERLYVRNHDHRPAIDQRPAVVEWKGGVWSGARVSGRQHKETTRLRRQDSPYLGRQQYIAGVSQRVGRALRDVGRGLNRLDAAKVWRVLSGSAWDIETRFEAAQSVIGRGRRCAGHDTGRTNQPDLERAGSVYVMDQREVLAFISREECHSPLDDSSCGRCLCTGALRIGRQPGCVRAGPELRSETD